MAPAMFFKSACRHCYYVLWECIIIAAVGGIYGDDAYAEFRGMYMILRDEYEYDGTSV